MLRVEPLAAGPVSRQAAGRLRVETAGSGLLEFTEALARFVAESGIRRGLLHAFCRHTSASLVIQENAAPAVRRDLMAALDRLAPREIAYAHADEGPDDMPAHIRSMLTGPGVLIPVADGRLALGTWQGVFLVEHRDRPHRREVLVTVIGD